MAYLIQMTKYHQLESPHNALVFLFDHMMDAVVCKLLYSKNRQDLMWSCCDIKFLVSYALTSSIMGCEHSAVIFVSSDSASTQNKYQLFHQNHSNDQMKHDNIKEKMKPREWAHHVISIGGSYTSCSTANTTGQLSAFRCLF